jgi:predicted nucleotidyltransferase
LESSDVDILVASLGNDKYWEFLHELEETVNFSIDLYTDKDDPVFVKKIMERGEVFYEI